MMSMQSDHIGDPDLRERHEYLLRQYREKRVELENIEWLMSELRKEICGVEREWSGRQRRSGGK